MSEEDFAILNDLKEYVCEQKQELKKISKIKKDPNYIPSLSEIKIQATKRLEIYNIEQ